MQTIRNLLASTLALSAIATAEPKDSRTPWNTPVPGQGAGEFGAKNAYSVEIVGVEAGEPVLIVKKGDEVLFKEGAEGWLIDSHESPEGGYLAVNERRGNSGDYLWILDVKNRRVIKRPEDKLWETLEAKGIASLNTKAQKKWGEGAEGDRSWGTAARWENEQTLIARVAVRYLNANAAEGEDVVLDQEFKLQIKPEGITVAE